MKICVITDVPISIEHGMGRYIQNLSTSIGIPTTCIYNLFELTNTIVDYINDTFDVVSVQIGLLKLNQKSNLEIFDKLKIKKVATIHSVVDKEVDLYLECMKDYFNHHTVEVNCVWGSDYQKSFIDKMDGFVFYTKNDMDVFFNYYETNSKCMVISPSIEYCISKSYSDKIKKNKKLGFLGRVDYRKGTIASLNSMDMLEDYKLNVYGMIMNQHDVVILNHFLSKNGNITYKGLLSDKHIYFDTTSIFLGNSLYEPFGFSHVENLFNFVVPIIGKGTGTHDVFGWDYPFVIEDSVPQLVDMVTRIEQMGESELYAILKRTQNNLIHLTDEYFRERYLETIKSIV